MKRWLTFSGIHGRILLISVVPLVIITGILTTFTAASRSSDVELALKRVGLATVSYLAAGAEYGMYAGDRGALAKLSAAPLKTPSITGVIFVDKDRQQVASTGSIELPADMPLHAKRSGKSFSSAEVWYFSAPVILAAQTVSDYEDESSDASRAQQELLGWVVISISLNRMLERQQEVITVSILVASLVLFISVIIAIRIGRSISSPVKNLTQLIQGFEAGNMLPMAKEEGATEIQTLARGINRLASNVRDSNRKLKKEVSQATQQLRSTLENLGNRNSDLESTQKELETAIAAKDHFLARMSHELRTPLTSVIGFSKLLTTSTDPAEHDEYTRNILQSSSLLLSIIDDILDYSKMQSDAIVLETIEFDLQSSLEDIVAMHAYNAFGKSIELVLLVESDVPCALRGDPMRLRQIINNLLGNSIKFTAQGEVIVRVSNLEQQGNEVSLGFSVKDSGVGMDPEQMGKLFKPFSQADTSITRRFGGSGLGLVICKQLVELMGGKIIVESQIDKGTEFSFNLRLLCEAAPSTAQSEILPQRQQMMAVYDRHPWSRRSLRNQLSRWSTDVYAAANTAKLMELLHSKSDQLEVLLLGLSPAEMAEIELTELLSTVRILYHGPIILLACLSNLRTKIPASIYSTYDPIYCLSKPLRQENLQLWLESIVEGDTEDGTGRPAGLLAPAAELNRSPLSGLTVLVAEDNAYNLQLITTIVELAGATAVGVGNGREAVSAYEEHAIDIILMDIHMPEMDGIDATREIINQQSKSEQPQAAILGLTANVIANEEQELRKAGALEILYKPIDEDALIKAIGRHCGRAVNELDHSILSSSQQQGDLKHELARQVSALSAALDQGNQAESREIFHQLSGISGLFGMSELRERVAALREAIQQGKQETIQQRLLYVTEFVSNLHAEPTD